MNKKIKMNEFNEEQLNSMNIKQLTELRDDLQKKLSIKEIDETKIEEYENEIIKQKKLINKYKKYKENNQLDIYKKEYHEKKLDLLKKKEELENLENKIKKNDKSFVIKNKSNNISINRNNKSTNNKLILKKNNKSTNKSLHLNLKNLKNEKVTEEQYFKKIAENKEINNLYTTNKKKIKEIDSLINELNVILKNNKNSIDNIYLNGLIKNYEDKWVKVSKKYEQDLSNYLNKNKNN